MSAGSNDESRAGSNDGLLTIARTAPVRGSSATTAPRLSPSASYAASCAAASSVVMMLPPCGSRPVIVSESRRTKNRSSSPESTSSSLRSRPVRP